MFSYWFIVISQLFNIWTDTKSLTLFGKFLIRGSRMTDNCSWQQLGLSQQRNEFVIQCAVLRVMNSAVLMAIWAVTWRISFLSVNHKRLRHRNCMENGLYGNVISTVYSCLATTTTCYEVGRCWIRLDEWRHWWQVSYRCYRAVWLRAWRNACEPRDECDDR